MPIILPPPLPAYFKAIKMEEEVSGLGPNKINGDIRGQTPEDAKLSR